MIRGTGLIVEIAGIMLVGRIALGNAANDENQHQDHSNAQYNSGQISLFKNLQFTAASAPGVNTHGFVVRCFHDLYLPFGYSHVHYIDKIRKKQEPIAKMVEICR